VLALFSIERRQKGGKMKITIPGLETIGKNAYNLLHNIKEDWLLRYIEFNKLDMKIFLLKTIDENKNNRLHLELRANYFDVFYVATISFDAKEDKVFLNCLSIDISIGTSNLFSNKKNIKTILRSHSSASIELLPVDIYNIYSDNNNNDIVVIENILDIISNALNQKEE